MNMRRIPTMFLQSIVVLIGIGALAFLLWEPTVEGRNAHATLFQIYFNDPFLAYAYTASIAFFVALYQTFKLLGYLGRDEAFSPYSVRAVHTIKYCALAIIGFVVPAVAYLFIIRPGDDIAGGVFIGLLITLASSIAAAAASVFEGLLQSSAQ